MCGPACETADPSEGFQHGGGCCGTGAGHKSERARLAAREDHLPRDSVEDGGVVNMEVKKSEPC